MQQHLAIPPGPVPGHGDQQAGVRRSALHAWQGQMQTNPLGQVRAPIPWQENPPAAGHTAFETASMRTMAYLGLRWGENQEVDRRFQSLLGCVHGTLEDVRQQRRYDLQEFVGFAFPEAVEAPPVFEEVREPAQQTQLPNRRLRMPAELLHAGLPMEAADLHPEDAQGLFEPHGNPVQEDLPPGLVPPPSALLWGIDEAEAVNVTSSGRGCASSSSAMPVHRLLEPPSSAELWKVDEAVTGIDSVEEASPPSSVTGGQCEWRSTTAESRERFDQEVWKNTVPSYVVKNTFVEPADNEREKAILSAGHFFSEPRRQIQ